MCGVAGVICRNGAVARLALREMVSMQTHRGPDGAGEHYESFGEATLGLGHQRLSIIDLSTEGAQPMIHPQTGDVLIYNGELYNYREVRRELRERGAVFRGDSDSEVLLHALVTWGPKALDRFEGMFAFAFYRAASQELLLARDPLGIKPLYVGRGPGVTVFASEVRTVIGSGLIATQIDQRGVAGLLSYGACQHPFTTFANVRSFAAGSWQIVTPDAERQPVRYWTVPSSNEAYRCVDAPQAIRSGVEAAVRDHLVGDVPVGLFLSSGLDSTIVAGVAARCAPGLRSFTVGFADNPDLSELELAAATARQFDLDHTQISIEGADALAAASAWLDDIDLPSIDGLNVYIISQAVREYGIPVALSGQGGDELFGGYSSFTDVPRLHRLMGRIGWLPARQRRQLAALASAGRSASFRAKAMSLAESGGDLLSLYTNRRRLMVPEQLRDLGLEASALGLDDHFLDPAETATIQPDPSDPVWSVSQFESRLYLANMLLRVGDENSMAHSLEVRVPFLDRRLLNLGFALPGQVRIPQGGAGKYLLRAAFPDMLRDEILKQPKHGFALPIQRWMLGPLREVCRNGLNHLSASGVVAPHGVNAIWSAFINEPDSPAWSRAFACCVLGHYLQRAVPSVQMRGLAS